MKAVIPCALKEDSLFPMIESKPTAMMPVMGKPLVRHMISNLQQLGVDDIYLVTNYMEDRIKEEFEQFTNVNVVRQEELNGTAGAVEQCSFIEDDFLVVNGDVLVSQSDIESLLEKHEEDNSSVTVLADVEDTPEKFGVLSIKNDRIEELKEKPEKAENSLINTGVYVFKPEIFDYISELGEQKELTDAVKQIISDKKAKFEIVEDYWVDIGSPKKLWEADRKLRAHRITDKEIDEGADVHESADIIGNAKVEAGAEIKPGTVIEGNVYVGEDAEIGPNTCLRDCTVGKRSQIRSADIDSALLFEENIIDSSAHLETVVMGEECDVKSNTTIRESYIGPRSFIEMNNSIRGVKFVPDARTDLGEISK